MSAQLGHICCLVDKIGRSVPLDFKSYKPNCVVRYAMGGEVVAFSDLFDRASTIAKEIGYLYNRYIPIKLLGDSKRLFGVISKESRTFENRIMLNIAAAREGFRDLTIYDIRFVRSSKNLADGLTKQMSQAALQFVVSSGYINIKPERWIFCR